ncbi:hypothetical protein [Occultella kanbiaonis]|uniref:hypothetical protein n=1 Tax=Occultella kanbiaonis TaxID=2675754 RepID=UPI0013D75183|nr:hypothetical protein [Occultella kanbiaonis]
MSQRQSSGATALPPLSRRGFLGIGAATIAAFGADALSAPGALATSAGTVLPLVDALPDGAPDRTAFAPHEQVFGQYLLLLAPLANSVVDDDPELFGWMEDGWWRTPNHPRNSRIMEHVATLSWFLVNERPWNPYYLDPNLEARLDAAIGYYLGLQGPRGAWPVTYEEESLATTGFGLVSLGNLQRDLKSENLLPDRQVELEASMRRAAQWLMDTSLRHWATPLQLTNQLVGGLAGVGHASVVIGDPQLAADLDDRIALLAAQGQAPAGYFHDPLIYDNGYNSDVMMPDLADLYQLTGNPQLVDMARKWADFAQYVMLPEPGAPGWVNFAAASARNSTSTRTLYPDDARDRYALARAFVPEVPRLGLYASSREDKAASRAEWAASTEPIPPLVKPNASPRLYMHVPMAPENLGRAELDALTAQLRPVAEETFTEYREGTADQQLLFVRRPGYYLANLLGRRYSDRIRSGTGLLWHPTAGTVVLSLNNVADDHWTTMTASGADSALTDVVATFHGRRGCGRTSARPRGPRRGTRAVHGPVRQRRRGRDHGRAAPARRHRAHGRHRCCGHRGGAPAGSGRRCAGVLRRDGGRSRWGRGRHGVLVLAHPRWPAVPVHLGRRSRSLCRDYTAGLLPGPQPHPHAAAGRPRRRPRHGDHDDRGGRGHRACRLLGYRPDLDGQRHPARRGARRQPRHHAGRPAHRHLGRHPAGPRSRARRERLRALFGDPARACRERHRHHP